VAGLGFSIVPVVLPPDFAGFVATLAHLRAGTATP
jgi:hypothetical protein